MDNKPTIWLKKVGEFNPTEWRAAGYSKFGNAEALIENYLDGDLILFMISGSSKHQTKDKGRLVALAEYEPKIESMLKHVSNAVKNASHNRENGEFKWEEALPLTKIYELPTRPFYKDILSKNRHEYDKKTRCGSTKLLPEDVDIILSLKKD